MKDIFHKYTGIMPEKVNIVDHPTSYGGRYKDGELTLLKPKGVEMTPKLAEGIIKERFNSGISPKHHGKEVEGQKSIPHALYHITSKLPKPLAKELSKIPLHTYNTEDASPLFQYLPQTLKRNMKAKEILDKELKGGVALKSKYDGKPILHVVMSPNVKYDTSRMIRILGHEVGHLLHDLNQVEPEKDVYKYFRDVGFGTEHKRYSDPKQKVRESLAEFFAHLNKHAHKYNFDTLHDAMPTFLQRYRFPKELHPGLTNLLNSLLAH